ncbi:MAG: T9SS type A sorting domain-containing protein [Bacteroidales bacterium]|nr:T9SS type A sorting domain-containing protein [Bacteroidales bacterium]
MSVKCNNNGDIYEVDTIYAIEGSFLSNLSFSYKGHDDPHFSVDRLGPYNSETLIKSDDGVVRVAINENDDFKLISSSIIIAALADGNELNIKPYYLSEIINYFLEITTSQQIIEVNEGFQFVSSNIDPENPDMTVVTQEIITDELDFIRNSNGEMLRKIGPNWVNGIGDWIVSEGYLIKTSAAGQFTVDGNKIPAITPISVFEGFQFVSYYPENEMDASIAFETIIGDDLAFIRDSQGQMIRKIGPNWVNGIGNCNSGQGYLVKMFADGEIIYPATAKSSSKKRNVPKYFNFEGGNASDPVYTIYVKGLKPGDEVAAFDGDKLIGSMKISSDNVFDNSLAVFNTLNNQQGFIIGNPIILKVWSENEIYEADYTMESVYDSYVSDVYPENDGEFSVVNISKNNSIKDDAIIIYPNPAIDFVNIVSQQEIKDITVFNFVGQAVYHGENKIINTSNFKQGIYFVKIKTIRGIYTKKLTIR